MVMVNTYDGREELRSRAAGGHEGRSCYILTEIETLREKGRKEQKQIPQIDNTNQS